MRVLWISTEHSGAAVPYDIARHRDRAWNFLFWEECAEEEEPALLIVGNGNYGGEEKGRNASHKSLAACAREYGVELYPRRPDGAGRCGKGRIERWTSEGYDVNTPDHLRARIAAALGMPSS